MTMADFAAALGNYNRKINTAVIACSNYEAGQQVTKYLQQMLPERGIKVIAEVPLDTQAQDHTASMLAEGLAFGEDRMPKDSTSMMVQWSTDRKLEVVWPDLYAQTKPRV